MHTIALAILMAASGVAVCAGSSTVPPRPTESTSLEAISLSSIINRIKVEGADGATAAIIAVLKQPGGRDSAAALLQGISDEMEMVRQVIVRLTAEMGAVEDIIDASEDDHEKSEVSEALSTAVPGGDDGGGERTPNRSGSRGGGGGGSRQSDAVGGGLAAALFIVGVLFVLWWQKNHGYDARDGPVVEASKEWDAKKAEAEVGLEEGGGGSGGSGGSGGEGDSDHAAWSASAGLHGASGVDSVVNNSVGTTQQSFKGGTHLKVKRKRGKSPRHVVSTHPAS